METQSLSLQDLAAATSVEIRTIRSWIQAGLLPRPENMGRNSSYPRETLTRLLAIKAMRNQFGMALSAIRMELTTADSARIIEYAALAGGSDAGLSNTAVTPVVKVTSLQENPPPSSTAADYLKALRATGVYATPILVAAAQHGEPQLGAEIRLSKVSHSVNPQSVDTDAANEFADHNDFAGTAEKQLHGRNSRLHGAIKRLERAIEGRQPRRSSKGVVNLSIPVTPDVELTIRGPLSPDEIAGFEKIAAYLRELLIGGLPNGE